MKHFLSALAFMCIAIPNLSSGTQDFTIHKESLFLGRHHLKIGDLSDVRYLLWTRSNSNDTSYFELQLNSTASLQASPFEGQRRTYFIYHGFNDFGETQWILNAKTDLLIMEDCNVFSVDWRRLVIAPFYLDAIDNMYLVGQQTAGLIDWLVTETELATSNVHVIGHSLGAHAAGMTGYYVQVGIVDRVTGLDPAGPLFQNKTSDGRISIEDAAFVDVMHTNSGELDEGCIALYEPTGHVDFYPNGGQHQPGCAVTNVTGGNWLDLFGGCSHARVTTLFVESILGAENPPGVEVTFVSWPCNDWDTFFTGGCPTCGQGCLDMGIHVNKSLTGSYYLRTNPEEPFALGNIQ